MKQHLVLREAIETGKSVRELCLEHGVLTEEELDIILDPFEMTHPEIAGASLLKIKKCNVKTPIHLDRCFILKDIKYSV